MSWWEKASGFGLWHLSLHSRQAGYNLKEGIWEVGLIYWVMMGGRIDVRGSFEK